MIQEIHDLPVQPSQSVTESSSISISISYCTAGYRLITYHNYTYNNYIIISTDCGNCDDLVGSKKGNCCLINLLTTRLIMTKVTHFNSFLP